MCVRYFQHSPLVQPPQTLAPATFHTPPAFDKLRVTITPHLNPEQLRKNHQPLTDYLAAHLGVPVEFSVAQSYDELGALLGRKEIDIAEFSPFAYVRAQDRGVLTQPLVSTISDGSATA